MPELIDRGHIYIAQPPLFKIKKGKNERYMNNKKDMQKYLMKKATENVTVKVNATGAEFKGAELRKMLEKLAEMDNYLDKLERRLHDRKIVETVIDAFAGPNGLLTTKAAAKLHEVFEKGRLFRR